jgi:hypothetical protein
MYRCLVVALALSAPFAVAAQMQRNFPHNALRGELALTNPPDVLLNGEPARLAPGARIRGADNLLLVSGAIVGQKYSVHYTRDTLGLVKDVWLLRSDELQRLWPQTAADAARWSFDPVAQTWTKP